MKTVSELKRSLRVGSQIKTVKHFNCPNKEGIIRLVDEINSTGFKFSDGCWMQWPKASSFQSEENGFSIIGNCKDEKFKVLQYEVI